MRANVSEASRFAYLINEKTEFRSQEAEHGSEEI